MAEQEIALPQSFSEIQPEVEAGLPPSFADVSEEPAPPRPIVGFGGVESPSAALQAGAEASAMLEERKRIKQERISSILGPAYEPDGKFEGSFFSQVDMSRSSSLVDKQKKFRAAFPDGDLVSVPTNYGAVLLARQDKSTPYREVGILPSVVGGLISEPMAAGVAGSVLFGPVGTFAATTLAVRGQTAIEQARGFGTGEPGWFGAAEEGAIAGVFEAGTRGASRLLLGRVRTVAQQEAAMRSVLAAQELGLEPITVGQISGPFGRGLFRQVAATSSIPEKVVTVQEQSLLKAVKGLSEEVIASKSDDVLTDIVRAQQNELNSLIAPRAMMRADVGEAIQSGLETYKKASTRLGNIWYDRARKAGGDVIFDLSPAKRIANDIDIGVLGAAEEGGVVQLKGKAPEELASVVKDIMALDSRIARFESEGLEFLAFDQVKTLRTRLFDLKFSDVPSVRGEANRLWQALRDVMDHPVSGNPEFTAAYQKASAIWALKESTLEKSFVAQALKSDTPAAIARKFMNPNNATELATIRDLIPRPRFEEFRSGFIVDVANSPTAEQGLARLRNFRSIDPEGFGILVTPQEERELTKFLVTKSRYESSPARAMLDKQMTEGERFVGMVKSGTVGDLTDAINKGGGKNSDYAKMAKAGVYKSILDDASTVNKQGVDVIDSGKLLSSVEKWKKSGRLDVLFDENDWRKIQLFQSYAAPLSETADIGGGMMAGGLRQKAIDIPMATLMGRFEQIVGGVVRPLWSNSATAWLLSRPASYLRVAAGGGKRPPISEMTAAMVLAEQELSRTTAVPLEGR